MAANSWMQHPIGSTMVSGKPQLNDVWAPFTNPVSGWGHAKVLFAALVTGAARLALVVLVPTTLFAMLVGDELGAIEARYQAAGLSGR